MKTIRQNNRDWKRKDRQGFLVALFISVLLTLIGIRLVGPVKPAEKSSPGYKKDFPDQDSIEAKEYWDIDKEL